ncbi:hypothetical protein LR48_Vigan10g048800 [Vigna angularis]|uniref:Uncharacterized protein n=2 Tax=Phaseolus angularis TaxID=3914 RepID=A0A0L9VHR5_PHAAN|nr:kunitz trypsin inhibitor 5 [Vigna angularis]KOM54596.1 hypothetical protein LR48_Vigan10g048800 [Vigna angularis]BAU02567.1 hypothetical protein VIGAN_11211800 [Vigna angularis var. angularis]
MCKPVMKNIVLAFVLLFALSLQPPLRATDAPAEPVVDTSGKKLQVDQSYYIVPAMRTFTRCGKLECLNAEGLSLANIGETCPLDVVVVQRSFGLPLSFSPFDTNEGVVLESTDLNIVFSTDRTSCDEYSLVWKLDHFGGSKGEWVVTTGGSKGNPGRRTIRNWFKIDKCDGAYKIVYCPSVCLSSKHLCKDVGVFVDENGNRRLALSDVPFKVKFQLAKSN